MQAQPYKAGQSGPVEISADLVIDTIPDGLIVLDGGCRIRRWNKAMERLTGYRQPDVLGKPYTLLEFRDAESGELLEQERHCLTAGRPDPERIREIECTLQPRHGEAVTIRKYGRVLAGPDGQAVGILLVLEDLRPLRRLEAQLACVVPPAADKQPPGRLIGTDPAMQAVYHRIRLAAQTDVTVLITGETGTGKELAAEALHNLSARRNKPLVRVNCSALSENLLESELFGHVKGAFTGAVKNSPGRIEAAEGGTLFLDEIGDISPLIQLKLLRVLQEHEYERVGDAVTRKANVRFIAATHRNLRERVDQGLFREDFYYRIRVYAIALPALRAHKADILPLCEAFIAQLNRRTGKAIRQLAPDALHVLMDYCWPGNVRQLENAVEHAFVTCQGDCITLEDLPGEIRSTRERQRECARADAAPPPPWPLRRQRVTRQKLIDSLAECQGNQTEAARRLGLDRTTVWRMLRRYTAET